MLINNKYTVPDVCPPDCPYFDDIMNYGQNALCRHCPVFACRGPDPMVPPDGCRDDWAQDWDELFKSGMTQAPALKL